MRLFAADPDRSASAALYAALVRQARRPEFYTRFGIPDTVDGRFELLVLHAFVLMHRLKAEPGRGGKLAQALFDIMFEDMDINLREMGAGDLGVGSRVKSMIAAFYGRTAAYANGLAEGEAALRAALRRNLYGTVVPEPYALSEMAVYLVASIEAVEGLSIEDLSGGRVAFVEPGADRRRKRP